jgi:aryl carrier-like protein
MSIERSETALREQAMEALKESTTMLDVASNLLDAGNREEAIRLKDQARAKRNVSVWLMSEANTLENAKLSDVRSQHHQTRHDIRHKSAA